MLSLAIVALSGEEQNTFLSHGLRLHFTFVIFPPLSLTYLLCYETNVHLHTLCYEARLCTNSPLFIDDNDSSRGAKGYKRPHPLIALPILDSSSLGLVHPWSIENISVRCLKTNSIHAPTSFFDATCLRALVLQLDARCILKVHYSMIPFRQEKERNREREKSQRHQRMSACSKIGEKHREKEGNRQNKMQRIKQS